MFPFFQLGLSLTAVCVLMVLCGCQSVIILKNACGLRNVNMYISLIPSINIWINLLLSVLITWLFHSFQLVFMNFTKFVTLYCSHFLVWHSTHVIKFSLIYISLYDYISCFLWLIVQFLCKFLVWLSCEKLIFLS